MSTVSGLIAHAEATPDKSALIVDGIEVSFGGLLARSAAIARLLRVNEVSPGDRVLYCTQNKLNFAAAFLGITGSGRIAVPVPDGAAPATLLEMGKVSEASAIIVDHDVTPPSGFAGLQLPELDAGSALASVALERSLGEFERSHRAQDAGALLLFTSGTTSKKKGVLLDHGNLMSATRHINAVMGIDATIREYVAIPLHHSFGLGRLRCVLQVGGTLVVDNGAFDPAKLLHGMGRLRINALSSVPAGFALFMGRLESLLARVGDPIRVVEIGSAAMPAEHKEKLLQLLPNARLFMHYGLTEASRTTFIELRSDRDHWDTVGKPAPGVAVSIVDEHGEEVGPHQEGEIVVRGGHVAKGYFRDPERTRRAFRAHGFRTGDFGFLDDSGFLHLRGRKDELINCGGVKISPLELETKLRSVLVDVDFAVVGVRDPSGVAGEIPVVAYVSTGEPLTLEWFLERCTGVVDKYELPRALLPVDHIPRTENGKVMRRALEESIGPRLEAEQVAARSALVRELVTIWRTGLDASDVGVGDSFFGLGGDSLKATILVNELRERLGEDVYVNALFEAPTVAQLAEYLEKRHPRAVGGLMARAAPGDENSPAAVAASGSRNDFHKGGKPGRSIIPPAPILTSLAPSERESATANRVASKSPAGSRAFRVSLDQQRLWLVEQLRPGSSAYHLPEALFIDGDLDVGALRRSFTELARRHESLRTTFGVVGDEPVQIVASAVDVEFRYGQLEGAGDRETDARRLLHEELQRPFDLERGPLFRVRVLDTGEGQYLLIYNMHHIVSDGWSREILWRDVSALYEAFRAGQPSPLPELPVQYSDFAAWQRQRLQGDALDAQLAYWKRQLAGLETLELLTDHPRPGLPSFRGAVESRTLPERTVRAIRALCVEDRVTVFMVLLAAFKALLHRYTGQDDIVVGSPVAGRNRKEIEGLIGFFVNMLVLRTDLSGDPSGRELISRVRDAALGAMRHQEMPFEKLVEELDPERDQSRNPLFQVTFQHSGRHQDTLPLSGASARRPSAGLPTTRFDLEVRVLEGPTGIRLAVTYSTDLYESATIERMLTHFQVLLEGMLEDPDARITQLPLLAASERRVLVEEWNDTATSYPRESSIAELFEEQVERSPDAVAVEFEGRAVTYSELNRRANRVARYLIRHGVGPEVKVGVALERSVEMVVAILGTLKAGGAYVPLDPGYPKSRLAYMVEETRTPVLLTQAHLVGDLPRHDGAVARLDADWDSIASESGENPGVRSGAEDLAYVMYTSGSTGRPKASCIVHRAVVRLVKETNFIEVGPEDVFLQFAPISFDASTLELWGSLLNGAKLVVFPPRTPSLEELGRAIERHGVTTLWLTGALFQQTVDARPGSFRKVRQLLTGGEVLSVPHVRRVIEDLDGDRVLINGYGPTENTTFTCCHVMGPGSRFGRSVPIGRPIANTQVYILDRRMEPVPIGAPGELYAGGDGLAREYLNDPGLTAETLVPSPFGGELGSRLYRTGDLARYLPDGTIEFLGRNDEQVKLRGFRIELGEIERALLRHEAVREAVVLCREDEPGEKYLAAYVVIEGKETGGSLRDGLREFLRGSLPPFMVPTAVVSLDALPVTPNGKVDRRALPAPGREIEDRPYVEPRGETERRLAGIWAELLGVDRVGADDDFFDLGGHSLLAMTTLSRVWDSFQVRLPWSRFFDKPTVGALAEYIDGARWVASGGDDRIPTASGDRKEGEI